MTRDPARRLADELDRRGLAAPARLLFDAHRPLGPLLSDLAVAAGPLVSALIGPAAADGRRLAEDPGALDRLVEELEGTRADAR